MNWYELRAKPMQRLRGSQNYELPDLLWIGLFTKPPMPEGVGYKELDNGRGYARQPVMFHSLDDINESSIPRNRDDVRFDTISHLDPQVTHCGVFDAQGELLFAGLLDGDGGRKPTGPIIFDRGKISIEWH